MLLAIKFYILFRVVRPRKVEFGVPNFGIVDAWNCHVLFLNVGHLNKNMMPFKKKVFSKLQFSESFSFFLFHPISNF